MTTTFTINGKPYTVKLASLPPDITLNTFIREHAGLSGTKFMCQEGGCGVCVCAVTGKHPVSGEVRTWAVNSCLTLLNTCDNLEITTAEGIGNKRIGFHPIQKRIAKMNGTQCGYCTPGFVMNMYALLQAKGGKVTMEEVENSFGGNICRCTGYRPILDAMKSFATDSNIEVPAECRDIEDLSAKTCPKTGALCSGTCNGQANQQRTPVIYDDGSAWFWPKTLTHLFTILGNLQKDEKYMLVAGNTAHGVYRRAADIKQFIDISSLAELSQHSINADSLHLGGNLSLTEAMDIFLEAAKKPGFEYCQQLWQHFDWIANVPVRNTGTLAGNLSIKHQHKEFPSDVFIAFEALDAQVVINENAITKVTVPLLEYLNTSMDKKIIHSFILKPYPREKYIFDSYKIMPRAQNAHAYVNAAFLVNVEKPSNKVISTRICFGGINPNFIHAKSIEDLLVGQNLFDPQQASKIFASFNQLHADIVLPDASPEYRQKLAAGLFYKFLLKHAPSSAVAAKLVSGGELLKRPVSSGKQIFEKIEKNLPVGKPTEKHEGLIQASGETLYSNDLPVQPNQVWCAFVTGKKIGATVTNVDLSGLNVVPGFVTYLSAKDIPGKNRVSGDFPAFFPKEEELFATGPIRYYNQPIGLVVAESNAAANRAAELVKITYSGGSTEIYPTQHEVLNSAAGAGRINHTIKSLIKELKTDEPYDIKGSGNLDMGLQYHFFMEPHSTVVVPTEGSLEVYPAAQWMNLIQEVISKLLNLKYNEVKVKVRRVGGGYGGKATRGNPAACGAALAAYKLNRPVRFVQSLESMMHTTGKRWPFFNEYEFQATKSGKIVSLKNTFYQEAGFLPNESPMGHTVLLGKNCYEFSDNYKLDGYLVITDSPNNTAARAPGSVEGIAMIENIIEHIAFEAGLDPVAVRMANLITGHKMNQMLPRFIESTNYKKRKQNVATFNAENRWHKKGLGLAIIEYHVGYFGQFPATVAIYQGDGTVMISHGGIEMGQGLNTKVSQLAAHALGIPIEMIKFDESNSMNGANAMVTGGSIGSETVCYAVRKCCDTLNARLKPIKEELKDSTWPQLVQEAGNRLINLIASDDCKPTDMDPYTVCALGLIEAEVDILTGNYQLNRVDILEDAGESLNPNVDVGQIEGAFMMGLSYWTSEQIVVDKATGELKTNRSWNYKPTGAKDIPIDFRIELLPRSPNSAGFMRSKATGEPAICLSVAVTFALQEALQSARNDAGLKRSWVTLNAPMTPEYVLLNAGTDLSMLKLK